MAVILSQFEKTTGLDQGASRLFIYDTTNDSDGGAWRKRCHNTSWYNEPLNTSSRGSRKEFPSVAIFSINSGSNQLDIYDADQPDFPLWMRFTFPSYSAGSNWSSNSLGLGRANFFAWALNSVACKNGWVIVGNSEATQSGGFIWNFISDKAWEMARYGNANQQFYKVPGRLSDRNDNTQIYDLTESSGGRYNSDQNPLDTFYGKIPGNGIRSVAVTVRPGAQINEDTGLPMVTFGLAGQLGGAIINDDGKAVSFTGNTEYQCIFDGDGVFHYTGHNNSNWYAVAPPYTQYNGLAYLGHTGLAYGKFSATSKNMVAYKDIVGRRWYGTELSLFKKGSPTDHTFAKGSQLTLGDDYMTGWMPFASSMSVINGSETATLSASTEYVTGGNFSSASDWSTGANWTISGGTASSVNNSDPYMTQTATAQRTYGKYYIATLQQSVGSNRSVILVNQNLTTHVQPNTGAGNTQADPQFVIHGSLSNLGATDPNSVAVWQQNSNNQQTNNLYSTATTTIDNVSIRELAIPDRSPGVPFPMEVKGSGNIHIEAVDTNAEMTCARVGDTDTWIEQEFNDKFLWGTNDFYWMFWVYIPVGGSGAIIGHGDRASNDGFLINYNPTREGIDYGYLNHSNSFIGNNTSVDANFPKVGQGKWTHVAVVMHQNRFQSFIDGQAHHYTHQASGVNWAAEWERPITTFFRRAGYDSSSDPMSAGAKLSMVRAGHGGYLDPKTIKFIYDQEKPLFSVGAKCFLTSDYGDAYQDPKTGELVVGGVSGGRVFDGLTVKQELNTAQSTTFAISGGVVAGD